jgi:hypothetical protein
MSRGAKGAKAGTSQLREYKETIRKLRPLNENPNRNSKEEREFQRLDHKRERIVNGGK